MPPLPPDPQRPGSSWPQAHSLRLDMATWPEVAAYLTQDTRIVLPVGSTEQHGPMGLIGTDAFCATAIAEQAARIAGVCVAPTLALTPAPFNTGFPGTLSISLPVFAQVFQEVVDGLQAQGFAHVYVLNAHGANLAPMREAARARTGLRIRSWWDFDPVNTLRDRFYGAWEGLHATPSEVSITQALYRTVAPGDASVPPRRLSRDDIKARAGDNHGPPERHRAEFPDGRVGAHSALATPEHGRLLLDTAGACVAEDLRRFIATG